MEGHAMTPNINNLPPHDMPAEQGALGCFLTDAKSLDFALEKGVKADWFYDLRHSTIFGELAKMIAQGKPVHDMIAVGAWFKNLGMLEGVGGLPYLSELQGAIPSSAALPYYLEILGEKKKLRSLLVAATDIISNVRKCADDPEWAIAEAERAILGVRGDETGHDDSSAKQIAHKSITALEERVAGQSDRIKTGWLSMDKITKGGWKPGQMIVIAARPATGKTAFAVTASRLMARGGLPVGIISLEMSDEELGGRMLAQESRLDWSQFDEHRQPNEAERRKIMVGLANFAKLPITVHEGHSTTIGAIAAKARRWKRNHGIRMLVIDYLQLVQGDPKRKREEQVAEVSRGVKGLARELKIPVMILAQLNRDIEKDKNRKPRLSDLRESGSIEQDADIVGMLYRAKMPTEFEPDESSCIEVNLFMAKQRGGRAGVDIPFIFNRELTEFNEIERAKPE